MSKEFRTSSGRRVVRQDYNKMNNGTMENDDGSAGAHVHDDGDEGLAVIDGEATVADADLEDVNLEDALRLEQDRQAVLEREKDNLTLRRQILQLRAHNAEKEREIALLKKSVSVSEVNQKSRGSREPTRSKQFGSSASRVDKTQDEIDRLLGNRWTRNTWDNLVTYQASGGSDADASRRPEQGKAHSESSNSEPEVTFRSRGENSASSDDGEFSLECRDRRGKTSRKHKNKQSGIKDKPSEKVVHKQSYPHAALQQEYMWGWSGDDIEYKQLTFGLFVAGELEIILGGNLNRTDATRRMQLLKTTAYRTQYTQWSKLLHLHAAILRKIETGLATWESDFDKIERMVLENPGRVDWSSRLGLKSGDKKSSSGQTKSISSRGGNDKKMTWWCRDYQIGTCNQSAPHTKNIRGREVTVRHICAKCFQKEGVERNHPDRAQTCPHLSEQTD